MSSVGEVKVKALMTGGGKAAAYRRLAYGDIPLGRAVWAEIVTALAGSMPGAAGLWLRGKVYRGLFGAAGRGVVIGRNVTLRHASKIRLGDRVILDENVVLDAKGTGNRGIVIGDDVYVGRNTILYCKNGDIEIGHRANISSNCQLFSSHRLVVEPDTVIGAYSYLLSGGEYDMADGTPFARQPSLKPSGDVCVGEDCWLGARVTVLDGAGIGAHSVIGAGAVVTRPVPEGSVAVGVPARVVRPSGRGAGRPSEPVA